MSHIVCINGVNRSVFNQEVLYLILYVLYLLQPLQGTDVTDITVCFFPPFGFICPKIFLFYLEIYKILSLSVTSGLHFIVNPLYFHSLQFLKTIMCLPSVQELVRCRETVLLNHGNNSVIRPFCAAELVSVHSLFLKNLADYYFFWDYLLILFFPPNICNSKMVNAEIL